MEGNFGINLSGVYLHSHRNYSLLHIFMGKQSTIDSNNLILSLVMFSEDIFLLKLVFPGRVSSMWYFKLSSRCRSPRNLT